MTDPQAIIARCTRAGVISWQNVAKQLGVSVAVARALYDPANPNVRPWPQPCEAVEPEPVIDENDLSSPYVKPEPLKERILKLLAAQSMSAEILGYALNSPRNSIRARLDRLLEAGKVYHDGRYPRTWGLMEEDGTRREYVSPEGGLSRGFNDGVDRAVTKHFGRMIATGGRIGRFG